MIATPGPVMVIVMIDVSVFCNCITFPAIVTRTTKSLLRQTRATAYFKDDFYKTSCEPECGRTAPP